MTGNKPVPRTMEEILRDTRRRLLLVERRLSVRGGLPARLGPNGAQITDWNNATEVGFYWSDNGALNTPVADRFVGEVYVINGGPLAGRVIQEVMLPAFSNMVTRTWRRTYNPTTGAWSAWFATNTSDALPDPKWSFGPSATSLTGGASSWQLIANSTFTYTPPYDLWVDVEASAIMKASTGYSMLGINITGGRTVGTDEAPDNSGSTSHWTPFTSSTVDTSVKTPVKRLLLPGGVGTNFMIYARRNVGSGTHTCNYPTLMLLPVRWG